MSLTAAARALVKATHIPIAILSLLNSGIWPKQADIQNTTVYDYIIIGGGTAGCVMARRLVENKNLTVLLLEAGGDPNIAAMLPGLFVSLPTSDLDYDYKSTPHPYGVSQYGRTKLTAGKMLGGSGSLNHFLAQRGAKIDFDTWAKISNGNWNYDSVLPYFIKSENVQDKEIIKAYPEYHGTTGPTGMTRETSSKTTRYLKSFASLNIPTILDDNSNTTVGYTQPLYTIADNLRQTPAYSYLKDVKDYSNLYVSKHTRVTKIIIENKTATGVEAMYNDKKYIFKARKEVILCAGVFNSPQLLMLSGIGHADHLKTFNIPVITNLPVGDNLKDQVSVQLVHKMETSIIPAISIPLPTRLAFPVITGLVALNKSQTFPDYESFNLILPHDYPYLILVCSVIFGYRDDICDRLNKESIFRNTFYTLVSHLQPKSSGTVRLLSTDASDPPLITMNYYNNTQDLEDMIDYIKDFIQVQKTPYFKQVNAKLAGLDLPECKSYKSGSRDFWKCFIINNSVSVYHTTSTCPMGSVVDENLKVLGIDHLRVVDASVLPTIPRSPPLPAVLMVAEKAAEMILKECCN